MEKKTSQGNRPPAVPRRTQSARILTTYTPTGKALRVTDEADQATSSRQPTRRWSQRSKTRRSLDAMERQADDLYDFLSDLEHKKASGSETDLLSFITESNSSETSSLDNSQVSDKSARTPPVLTKRVSVKDQAKLFLKPDIKEEMNEDNSKTKSSAAKTDQSRLRMKKFDDNNNNTNNNNSNSRVRSRNRPLRNGFKTEKSSETSPSQINSNSSHLAEKPVIAEKPKNLNGNTAINDRSADKDSNVALQKSSVIYKKNDPDVEFSVDSDASELSSEDSDSLSEAELSLASTSQSGSSLSVNPEAQNSPDTPPSSNFNTEPSAVSSPLPSTFAISESQSPSADLLSSQKYSLQNGNDFSDISCDWVGVYKSLCLFYMQLI